MKKQLAIISVLTLLEAGALFAQGFSTTAWGTVEWAPVVFRGNVNDDGEEVVYAGVGSGPAWQGVGASVGFDLTSDISRNFGFFLKMRYDGGSDVWFDDSQASIWARPFAGDILTVRIGHFLVEDLKGKNNDARGENAIFAKFESNLLGAHFILKPVTGLQLHASWGTNGAWMQGEPYKEALADIFGTGQYAIAYSIVKTGMVRAQFLSGTYGKGKVWNDAAQSWDSYTNYFPRQLSAWHKVQLAFNYTGTRNLNIDAGITIPLPLELQKKDGHLLPGDEWWLPQDEGGVHQAPIGLALWGTYQMNKWGYYGRFDATFNGWKVRRTGGAVFRDERPYFRGCIGPSYQIGPVGRIGGDVAYTFNGDAMVNNDVIKRDTHELGFSVYFNRNIGQGGDFQIGLSTNFPIAGAGFAGDANRQEKAGAFKISVPIKFSYNIW